MSDMGLYSELYEQTREFAEIIDEVLIGLKTGAASPNDPKRQRLSKLLLSLANGHTDNFGTKQLSIMLRAGTAINTDLVQISNALSTAKVNQSIIQQLEDLAQRLETEQIGFMTKMRGGAA